MFGPIEKVVFDLDGTLVNTMPSVIRGLGLAIQSVIGRLPSHEELLASFGPAPQDVLLKWMPADRVPAAHQLWLDFEKNLGPSEMRAFDGVNETLAGLKKLGVGLALFTGRDRSGALRILSAQGWLGEYFTEAAMVCGDDGHAPKPSPDALKFLLSELAWPPGATLMVGDHPYDMLAGVGAGTKTAAALWDLPQGASTERARFREGWTKWDRSPCDLRLVSPLSLLEWLKAGIDP